MNCTMSGLFLIDKQLNILILLVNDNFCCIEGNQKSSIAKNQKYTMFVKMALAITWEKSLIFSDSTFWYWSFVI